MFKPYYNEDADRYYMDVDKIRLVFEAYETHGAKHCGKLIGWYRPEMEDEEQYRPFDSALLPGA